MKIKNTMLLTIVVGVLLTMSGCASIGMVKSKSQTISPPSSGKAKVVFMRTSFVAGAIGVEMFETTRGKIKPIGGLSMGTKIVYETTPGKKVFMAYGTAADFMKANLVAGKTYYSIVRPNWATGGFAPTPIRTDGSSKYHNKTPAFRSWVSGTDLFEPEGKLSSWFTPEKEAEIKTIYDTYWARWQGKSQTQKAQRTLRSKDGM